MEHIAHPDKEFTVDMNKRMFCVLALSAASFLAAQRTPPTPAQMVTNRVGHLTTLLSLTTSQQAEATTIFTTAQAAVSGFMDSMKTARTALHAAVQKNDIAGINIAASQIGALTVQQVEAQAKGDAAFYAILTADQKTKFDELGGGGGFGGPGGGPRGFGGQGGPGPRQ